MSRLPPTGLPPTGLPRTGVPRKGHVPALPQRLLLSVGLVCSLGVICGPLEPAPAPIPDRCHVGLEPVLFFEGDFAEVGTSAMGQGASTVHVELLDAYVNQVGPEDIVLVRLMSGTEVLGETTRRARALFEDEFDVCIRRGLRVIFPDGDLVPGPALAQVEITDSAGTRLAFAEREVCVGSDATMPPEACLAE